MRLRGLATPKSGLLFYKLRSKLVVRNGKLQLPDSQNNIATFGLKPTDDSLEMMIRVFANEHGNVSEDFMRIFTGYCGQITWKSSSDIDSTEIDDCIDAIKANNGQTLKFNSMVYQNEPRPINST